MKLFNIFCTYKSDNDLYCIYYQKCSILRHFVQFINFPLRKYKKILGFEQAVIESGAWKKAMRVNRCQFRSGFQEQTERNLIGEFSS